MAALAFRATNTLLSSTFQELIEDAGGVANATASPQTGWVVGTTVPTVYSAFRAQTNRANSTFGATAIPTAFVAADCFRTTNPYSGSFRSGTWTFVLAVIGVTNSGAQDGNVRYRVWRSSSATGAGAGGMTTTDVALRIGSTATTLTTPIFTAAVTMTDSVSATDAITRTEASGRTLSDSVSVTDTIIRTEALERTTSDSVSVTDAITRA